MTANLAGERAFGTAERPSAGNACRTSCVEKACGCVAVRILGRVPRKDTHGERDIIVELRLGQPLLALQFDKRLAALAIVAVVK